jgi:hypothetical protein
MESRVKVSCSRGQAQPKHTVHATREPCQQQHGAVSRACSTTGFVCHGCFTHVSFPSPPHTLSVLSPTTNLHSLSHTHSLSLSFSPSPATTFQPQLYSFFCNARCTDRQNRDPPACSRSESTAGLAWQGPPRSQATWSSGTPPVGPGESRGHARAGGRRHLGTRTQGKMHAGEAFIQSEHSLQTPTQLQPGACAPNLPTLPPPTPNAVLGHPLLLQSLWSAIRA